MLCAFSANMSLADFTFSVRAVVTVFENVFVECIWWLLDCSCACASLSVALAEVIFCSVAFSDSLLG